MARYIDVEKIHKFVEDNFKGDVPYEWAWTLTAIDKAPTEDVVPVVRCKKCKNYNTFGCADGFGWCENFNNGVTDEHYCSYGERRCSDG